MGGGGVKQYQKMYWDIKIPIWLNEVGVGGKLGNHQATFSFIRNILFCILS